MQEMVILNYILRKSVGRFVGVACALRRAQRRAKRAANCRRKIFYSPAQFDLHPHNFFYSPAQLDLHPHNSSYTPAQKMQATRTERRPKIRQSPPEFAPAQHELHPHNFFFSPAHFDFFSLTRTIFHTPAQKKQPKTAKSTRVRTRTARIVPAQFFTPLFLPRYICYWSNNVKILEE
jgi:hypothetical protein